MGNELQENLERKHFNQMAERYDQNYRYHDPFTQYKAERRLLKLTGYLPPISASKIMEIGCGTGEYTRLLAKFYPTSQIYAFDISLNMVNVAREKCKNYSNIHFFVSSAYCLPYRYFFDLTCGFYILHHLDVLKAVNALTPTIKQSGVVSFFEPNILNPIVYVVKKISLLKELVGDTPGESAINPKTIQNMFIDFEILYLGTNEYIPVLTFLPLKVNILLDKITNGLRNLPLTRYFGGSVEMVYKKK